jgi:hypothetical protein
LPEIELRDTCRRHLDMAEVWLRRLVTDQFVKVYGADVLSAKDAATGNFRVKNSIREQIQSRMNSRPGRYTRPIDAADLDDLIAIVCHPTNFKMCFDMPLRAAFPLGAEHARIVLNSLAAPRNHLAHQNPISQRQAEQVVCYSGDLIESIKNFYKEIGMSTAYNVPSAIRTVDSFGNEWHHAAMSQSLRHINVTNDAKFHLTPGDNFWLETSVDPSFDPTDYKISWKIHGFQVISTGPRCDLAITERDVAMSFLIILEILSNKTWHKFGQFDDRWVFKYRVLPPPT